MAIRGQSITSGSSALHPWLLEQMSKKEIKSLRQLATCAGLTVPALHHALFNGHEMGVFKAARLAAALDVKVDELLEAGIFPAKNEPKVNRT